MPPNISLSDKQEQNQKQYVKEKAFTSKLQTEKYVLTALEMMGNVRFMKL